MGKWKRKRSNDELKIIGDVKNYLFANYHKYFREPYEELDKYFRDSLERRSEPHLGFYKTEDEQVKYYILDKIGSKVENDYDTLKKYLTPEMIANATKEELQKYLTLMVMLRNEDFGNLFYRSERTAENGLSQLNSKITKGKMLYNYEELAIFLINKWNENSRIFHNSEIGTGNCRTHTAEEVYSTNCLIELLEIIKGNIINSISTRDVNAFQDHIKQLIAIYDNTYYQIRKYETFSLKKMKEEKTVTPALLKATVLLDRLLGINRDMLLILFKFIDINEWDKMSEFYIKTVRKLLDENVAESEQGYSLFENYLLIIILYSLIGERNDWIEIQQFLVDEIIAGTNPVGRSSYERCNEEENIKKLLFWFKNQRLMPLGYSDEILEDSIYKEFYLYKKRPKKMGKFGINKLLEYIEDEKNLLCKNVPFDDFFYYEKILRGVFREYDNLDVYKGQRKQMIKIYSLEQEMFSHKNLSGRYLSRWARILREALVCTIKEYSYIWNEAPQ